MYRREERMQVANGETGECEKQVRNIQKDGGDDNDDDDITTFIRYIVIVEQTNKQMWVMIVSSCWRRIFHSFCFVLSSRGGHLLLFWWPTPSSESPKSKMRTNSDAVYWREMSSVKRLNFVFFEFTFAVNEWSAFWGDDDDEGLHECNSDSAQVSFDVMFFRFWFQSSSIVPAAYLPNSICFGNVPERWTILWVAAATDRTRQPNAAIFQRNEMSTKDQNQKRKTKQRKNHIISSGRLTHCRIHTVHTTTSNSLSIVTAATNELNEENSLFRLLTGFSF